ncbi:MAG TPA: hypothetical protein VFB72_18500 [Verrucomicrobiae bacterium]|nr:hypothetical protein [Verrucomicrobiae bacterium]
MFSAIDQITLTLLAEALRAELTAQGFIVSDVHGLGSLALGLVTATLANVPAALPYVNTLIERANLVNWTSIYWLDLHEGMFRTAHLADGAPQYITIAQLKAEAAVLRERAESSLRLALAFAQWLKNNPPPQNQS